MTTDEFALLFTEQVCDTLFPVERADEFFEALFGDASEGSYDLRLQYSGSTNGSLQFDLLLDERPGHCLACNLTYGLPQVFSRHPVIDIEGLVQKVNAILGTKAETGGWNLGATRQRTATRHAIPLTIELKN